MGEAVRRPLCFGLAFVLATALLVVLPAVDRLAGASGSLTVVADSP